MSLLFGKFRECLSSKPTRSERKRADILDAAIAEFQVLGLRDTSMDRIAEHAKVSKRTVYNHFESKEALFRAIVAEMLVEQDDSITAVYDPDRTLEDQLVELIHQDVELLQDEVFVGMARVLMAESFSTPDLAREAFGEAAQREHPLSRWMSAVSCQLSAVPL